MSQLLDEPVVDEPVVDEPVVDDPVVDEPVVDDPVDEPVVDEPVVDEVVYNKIMEDVNKKMDNITSNLDNKMEMLMNLITNMNKVVDKVDEIENESIIEEDKKLTLEEKISLCLENEDSYITLINQIYRLGFPIDGKIIDTNCHRGNFIEFLKERKYDCYGLSVSDELINVLDKEYLTKTDVKMENIEDSVYDLVLNFNFIEYLPDEEVKDYLEKLINISKDKLIIVIDFNTENPLKKSHIYERNLNFYLNIIKEIIKDSINYTIDQYRIPQMPQNVFILRKLLKEESELLKNINQEEKNIDV